jgi:hypothetical protein
MMSHNDSAPIVVGVDVGGPKKGFHAVAIREWDIFDTFATLHAGEVVAWCRRLGVSSVGIDAPCHWSRTGRARHWWQVGEARFATREDAEDHARTAGEMFVARYQNKPGGPVRRLLPVRETK